jgi:hypothetical protein
MLLLRSLCFLAVAALLFATPAYFFLTALDRPPVRSMTGVSGSLGATSTSLPEG